MFILLEVTGYSLHWLQLDDKKKRVKEELHCPVAANIEASTYIVKKSSVKQLRNQSHIALPVSKIFWSVISLDTSSKLIFYFWAIHSVSVPIWHSTTHLKVGLYLLLQLRWMEKFCMKTRQFPEDVFNGFFFCPLVSKNVS